MGKKVNEASAPTISKISEKPQRQQLSCLMKVLKPKVYITDTSNFKRLVQELTGNNSNDTSNKNTSAMISSPLITKTTDDESESRQQQLKCDDSSRELHEQMTSISPPISNQEHGHEHDQYRDFETWLLDMEPMVSSCENYGGIVEQEFGLCNYDYDLSGLL